MKKIIFEDNHIHSHYSDGANSLSEIFEHNNTHDKLNLIISDHVDENTDWFDEYVKEIRELRSKYRDFAVKIGCEVKIVDESGRLNTTSKILNKAEVVLGSVHHFPNIKSMSKEELLKKEFELTILLASNDVIDILAHPFNMCERFFKLDIPVEYIQRVYRLCVKNGIKFEYSPKHALHNVEMFVKGEIDKGNIDNFSFGSDAHHVNEIGHAAHNLAEPVNILITGAGAGVGQSILKAAKISKINKKIVVVDAGHLAAGLYRADAAYSAPFAHEKGYVDKIIRICKQEKIDIIFVGTDVELPILAKNKKKIETATRAILVISHPDAVSIADDKWHTVQFLKSNGFPHPRSTLPDDLAGFAESVDFPLVVKPRIGARSIGYSVVRNEKELYDRIREVENPVIQEYVGTIDDEYTCSAFFHEGECYGVLAMKRWLRNGDTYKAIVKKDKELEKFIARVGKKLKIFGPCNFQLRKTNKGPVIFEINCRFSGTTGAASYLGFNVLNALLHKIVFGRPLKNLSFKESYIFRFWNEAFIDEKHVESMKKKGYIKNPGSELNIF